MAKVKRKKKYKYYYFIEGYDCKTNEMRSFRVYKSDNPPTRINYTKISDKAKQLGICATWFNCKDAVTNTVVRSWRVRH